jgi:hypothetical protein
MRFLDRLHAYTLAIVALLAVFVTATVVSPHLPYTTLHAQQAGPGGVPGAGGGGGAVASVFGRTGAVVAASGDYTAAQVTNAAATNAANTLTQPQTITGSNASLNLNGFTSWSLTSAATADLLFFKDNSNSVLSPLFSNEPNIFNTNATGMALTGGSCYMWNNSNNNSTVVEAGFCSDSFGLTPTIQLGDGVANDTSGWLQLSAIGNGASGNTDLRGHLASASSTFSYTFTKTYTVAPTCVLNDTTEHNVPTFTTSTTTLSGTTTGASDNVNWVCAD